MDVSRARARAERAVGVVSREIDGEFVVLDPGSNRAHRLHGPAAEVWRSLREPVVIDIREVSAFDVVGQLDELGLIVLTPTDAPTTTTDAIPLPRRSVLRAGAALATAAGTLGIETIVLPTSAHAASVGFNYVSSGTGPSPVLVVPPSVTVLSYTLVGAGGGGGGALSSVGGAGGAGAQVTGTITIDRTMWPNDVHVQVIVGEGGGGAAGSGNGGTGYGTGGRGTALGAGGGGGGTAILIEGTPYIVAGGGGGGGRNAFTGAAVGGRGGDAGLVDQVTGGSAGNPGGNGGGGGALGDQAIRGLGGRTRTLANGSLGVGGTGGTNDGTVDGTTAGVDGQSGIGGRFTPARGGDGGAGGRNPVLSDRGAGGGGGGGWGGGGGGEAGTAGQNGRGGAGGGGGSSLVIEGNGFQITFDPMSLVAAGGAPGADGADGQASLTGIG